MTCSNEYRPSPQRGEGQWIIYTINLSPPPKGGEAMKTYIIYISPPPKGGGEM